MKSNSMGLQKRTSFLLGLLATFSSSHVVPQNAAIADESCLLQTHLAVKPKHVPAASKSSPTRARHASAVDTPPLQALSVQVSDLKTQMNGMTNSLNELTATLVEGPHVQPAHLAESGSEGSASDDDPSIFADSRTALPVHGNTLRKLSRGWAHAGLFFPQSWDLWLAANFLAKGSVVLLVILLLSVVLNWIRAFTALPGGQIEGQGSLKFAKDAAILSYGAVPSMLKQVLPGAVPEKEDGSLADHQNSALEAKISDDACNVPQDVAWKEMLDAGMELLAWKEMMDAGISTYIRQCPTKFRQSSRRGIPDEFRWQVWKAAVQCNEIFSEEDFSVLCHTENRWTTLIRADVCRTFPELEEFKGKGEALCRVLNAYANHDHGVGYCQGMNFIAGLLLLVSNDEKGSFCVLVRLMHHIGLRGFFDEHLPLLQAYTSAWDQLMAEKLPNLSEHFKQEGVEGAMYLHQWFLKLFIHCFPLPMVAVIWDIIICNGLPSILPIALAIMQVLEDSLLTMHKEDIIEAFAKLKEDNRDGKFNGYNIGRHLMDHLEHAEFPEHIPECLQEAHLHVAQGAL